MWLRASLLAASVFPSAILPAQTQAPVPPPQTARQALIEIIADDDQGLMKHLTVEMQKSMQEAGKGSVQNLGIFDEIKSSSSDFQTFESGNILLSASDTKTNERVEIHVESDDLSGDTDRIALSFHQFQDGIEKEIPYAMLLSEFSVGLKRQQKIWRLNDISLGIKVPVGDPNLLKKFGSSMPGMFEFKLGGSGKKTVPVPNEMPIENVLSLVAFAETAFASSHPEVGFTCSLASLAEANRFDLDPRIFKGQAYQGYKFALSSCQGSPVETFHLTAEPAPFVPGAQALCTDATRNIRVSDDGRGSTCLTSGKSRRETSQHAIGDSGAAQK